jgi:lipopolysaccharide transport system permease protein
MVNAAAELDCEERSRAVATTEPAVEVPRTVIEPRSGWQLLDLAELWRSRELLYFLVWRDIKVRYKQTVLGAAWAVVQPLATMAAFAVFLGRVGGISSSVPNYPLFVFAGLMPWTFFSRAVTTAGISVVANQHLVSKVYFPRLLIPIATVAAGVVDFLIAFAVLLLMMVWYGVPPGWGMLLAPVVFLLLALSATGIGALLAGLTVKYRDFGHILPFAVQIWMFATPTIYLPADGLFSPQWQALLPLNPAYGLIYNFRQTMLGGPLDWYSLAVSSGVGLGLLVLGCWHFRQVEQSFADVI